MKKDGKYKYVFDAAGYAQTCGYVYANNIEEAKEKAKQEAQHDLEIVDELEVRRA